MDEVAFVGRERETRTRERALPEAEEAKAGRVKIANWTTDPGERPITQRAS